MREIEASLITETIARLLEETNYVLGEDVLAAIKKANATEDSPLGKEILSQLLANAEIGREGKLPLCQDCGTAVFFLEIGQEVHISGGDLYEQINEGVRQGYGRGFLRKSMVKRPFTTRVNTGDNTPAIIYTEIVPGDHIKIMVMTKGGDSEMIKW